jgi:hypothetical protein
LNELKEIQMTASKLLSAISIALLAAAGAAHAESYDGVHQLTSAASRADVASQAVVAAHSANPYATGANAGPAQVIVSTPAAPPSAPKPWPPPTAPTRTPKAQLRCRARRGQLGGPRHGARRSPRCCPRRRTAAVIAGKLPGWASADPE